MKRYQKNKIQPIVRDPALQPISREHHDGLLLCWKLRKGIAKGIDFERMHAYCHWFWREHLMEHFLREEQYLFPLLGSDHPKIQRAHREHARLERLFTLEKDFEKAVSLIEEELEAHIRFEERDLFNEIQQAVNPEKLAELGEVLKDREDCPVWSDEFWK